MQHLSTQRSHGRRLSLAGLACALLGLVCLVQATPAPAATLEKVREAGRLTLGYRVDARPLSYQDESGKPSGYAHALCEKIAEAVKADLGLSTLTVDWVPLSAEDGFKAVEDGRVDLLCGTDDVTLARRKEVAFSIPVYEAGIGAMLRVDASASLRNVLEGRKRFVLIWRGTPAEILRKYTYSVLAGSRAETWLAGQKQRFQIDPKIVPVESHNAGVEGLLERRADVFFAERSILLDAANRSPPPRELIVLDRRFTYEPLALALQRGDEDLRLLVDRTLSRLFGSAEFGSLYAKWFGEPDEETLKFFQLMALPE